MKKQILLVFIICSSLYGVVKGQNLSAGNIEFGNREIYVLGTFHFREHDFEKYPPDISREIKRAIEYMPDIVCVEWIDKSEELDLYHKDYTENIRHLLETAKLDTANAQSIIDSLYLELAKNPDDLDSRSEIANYLYVTRDYINACYQWYLIENRAKDSIQLKTILPEDIARYRYSLYRDPGVQKSEIVEVAFPIAKSLAHEKIYSIDYRHDQREYNSHINKFSEPYEEKYGYDPMLKKAESLIDVYSKWLESDRINKRSTYFEKLNSKENEKLMFTYYYDMFLSFSDDPDYRKWHELQLEKRNWKMFELLIQAIRESNAQKTFVLVGTTHKIYLERYLKEANKFIVTDYNDLK
jgi:hypothetical protein